MEELAKRIPAELDKNAFPWKNEKESAHYGTYFCEVGPKGLVTTCGTGKEIAYNYVWNTPAQSTQKNKACHERYAPLGGSRRGWQAESL